jgi:hypothetical protein
MIFLSKDRNTKIFFDIRKMGTAPSAQGGVPSVTPSLTPSPMPPSSCPCPACQACQCTNIVILIAVIAYLLINDKKVS